MKNPLLIFSESKFFSFLKGQSGDDGLFTDAAWFIRYSIAMLVIALTFASLLYAEQADNALKYALWVWAAIFGLWLVMLAREIVFAGLFAGVAYGIFQGILGGVKHTDTSTAIIIGAIIIAIAIYSSSEREKNHD